MTIEPKFGRETSDVILSRMLENVSSDVDKRQGSIAWDLLSPAAIELANTYVTLDQVLKYSFISEEMPSDLLTIAASEFGVDRKSAIKSSGIVTFVGPENTLIPAGTQVRTDNLIYFETIVDVELVSGQFSAEVFAVDGGSSGNVAEHTIDNMVGPLAGIVEVTNPFEFTNGVDAESDSDLIQRVYSKVRKPATSGNVYHYEQWAKEVPGVSDARVEPLWSGPGTVRVVLLGSNKKTPDPSVILEATHHIEKERPIGADVTVIGADEVLINISADVQLVPGTNISDVVVAVESKINSYLGTLAFKDSLVRYSRISSEILDVDGVIDYSNLTINGGTSNILIGFDKVAVCGTVSLNAV